MEDMTSLISRLYKVSQQEAYVSCSIVGSLRFGACVAEQALIENRCLVGLSIPKEIGLNTYVSEKGETVSELPFSTEKQIKNL